MQMQEVIEELKDMLTKQLEPTNMVKKLDI